MRHLRRRYSYCRWSRVILPWQVGFSRYPRVKLPLQTSTCPQPLSEMYGNTCAFTHDVYGQWRFIWRFFFLITICVRTAIILRSRPKHHGNNDRKEFYWIDWVPRFYYFVPPVLMSFNVVNVIIFYTIFQIPQFSVKKDRRITM